MSYWVGLKLFLSKDFSGRIIFMYILIDVCWHNCDGADDVILKIFHVFSGYDDVSLRDMEIT